MKYKIYCDMDNVLVDFNKGYKDLTGIEINEYMDSPEFWQVLNDAGKDYWVNLEWKSDGKKLWNYIKKYNPDLLSAPTKMDDSRVGKNEWVQRELPGVRLILRTAKNKKEFANKDSILIDDRDLNIEQWIEAGGIGILHTSTENTIKELKKIGL